MLATHLIRLVESHADELVHAVVRDLRTNPHTPSLSRVPEPELRHALLDLYKHLGDWIADQTEGRVEMRYRELGRQRCQRGIPLAEAVFALLAVKRHLRRYVQGRSLSESVVELYSEEQLYDMLSTFFDRAVYFMVQGYEEERRPLSEHQRFARR